MLGEDDRVMVSEWGHFCFYSDSGPLLVTGSGEEEDFAYLQFMEVTKLISGVDKVLCCVGLRWATGDELDRTLYIARYAGQEIISAG